MPSILLNQLRRNETPNGKCNGFEILKQEFGGFVFNFYDNQGGIFKTSSLDASMKNRKIIDYGPFSVVLQIATILDK